jgi:hypothetical protein
MRRNGMEPYIALGSDDGKNLKNDDYFGQSRYFATYKLSEETSN